MPLFAVLMYAQPFVRAFQHFLGRLELGSILDDVHVLDAETLTGTHHRIGVVGIGDILHDAGKMARATGKDLLEPGLALVLQESLQVGEEGRRHLLRLRLFHAAKMTKQEAGSCPWQHLKPMKVFNNDR